MMKHKKWIIALVAIGLIGLASAFFFLDGQEEQTGVLKPLSVGDLVPPELGMETISGEERTFQEFRGQVVLINYWASWCAPCIREMPSIFGIYAKLRERGFAVIAVNMDENALEGENFLRNKVGPIPFEMYKGLDTRIQSLFPLEGLPFSAVIDRDGKVVYAAPGEEDWSGNEMRKLIEGLL